jgi:hypothetical protein
LKLVYVIIDLGREKVIARYVGRSDAVAANRSLLHASLSNLEMTPMLTAEVTRVVRANWNVLASAPSGGSRLATVDGWVVEPGLAWQCATGLRPPSAGLAMSPSGDFTVTLRAAWYGESVTDVRSVARRCSPQPGAFGESSYTARATAWGIVYQVEGIFVPLPAGGVWQLEVVAPAEKSRFLSPLFAEWIKAVGQ